jgi:hypothetical protein
MNQATSVLTLVFDILSTPLLKNTNTGGGGNPRFVDGQNKNPLSKTRIIIFLLGLIVLGAVTAGFFLLKG